MVKSEKQMKHILELAEINKNRYKKKGHHRIGTRQTESKKGKPSKLKGIPKSKESVQKMKITKQKLFKEGKIKIWNKGLKGEEYLKHYGY